LLSCCEVRGVTCVLDTGGGAVDELCVPAETGIVLLAATAIVGVHHAGEGASYQTNQVNIQYKEEVYWTVHGRD